MHLNYSQNLHGILSRSTLLDETSSQDCRMVRHNDVLYCVYFNGDEIRMLSRRPSSAWTSVTAITGKTSANVPGLVSFKDDLVMVYGDATNMTVVCRYNEASRTFITMAHIQAQLSQTPAFAALNGILHMFYKVQNSSNIMYATTSDLINWSQMPVVKNNGNQSLLTYMSPVAATYQNLIHLIYQDKADKRYYMLKCDGENWTSSISLIDKRYPHSPGLCVHNGLLKLLFSGDGSKLDQYCYDGNAVSPLVSSIKLDCGEGSPALAVQQGALVAVYAGAHVNPDTQS
ncbi:hypothetical protein [Pseudomonas sp. NPDC090592]|uniref:hypothetical protein n=1 Tax=Pseudomonas sp. NPDC090592 TaxID=3364480 RepID=UPI00383BA6BB